MAARELIGSSVKVVRKVGLSCLDESFLYYSIERCLEKMGLNTSYIAVS